MPPRRKSSAKKRKAEELQAGAGPSDASDPAAPAAGEEKSEEDRLKEAVDMLMGALQNSIDADK